jgi:hypothetical protein
MIFKKYKIIVLNIILNSVERFFELKNFKKSLKWVIFINLELERNQQFFAHGFVHFQNNSKYFMCFLCQSPKQWRSNT